jgi:beta-galactosidase/beta-glucuronidase
MHAMKKLGCNLVRIHIAGVDPRIYNLADKIGMLLWVEVPSPHQSSHKSRANHKDELLRMLALIGSHPSIVIWSLFNEDWGVQDIATNGDTRQYIMDMYHYMQLAHPQFLVVDKRRVATYILRRPPEVRSPHFAFVYAGFEALGRLVRPVG